ncbi:transposase, partial [Puniceicoccaceae bacterium K14]|nr:transposase [Puniceicoccaceae bacterium K14]
MTGRSRCGRKPSCVRLKVEGILWILRCAAPWRDLPIRFGAWKGVYDASRRWSDSGLWESILAALALQHVDDEYLMIESSSS